jgi:ATP/maltotriose-dependent transcriptional regulator MalT
LHLVIVTRDDPNLPLARLRGHGQLIELRAADLRFASSEAAEFLNQVMGLDLAAEDITALEARTEGWIAGLQLAADVIWRCGEHGKLKRWLMKLPDEAVFSRPHLCIFLAWYLFASGQHDASESTLQVTEEALKGSIDGVTETGLQEWDSLTVSDRAQLRDLRRTGWICPHFCG